MSLEPSGLVVFDAGLLMSGAADYWLRARRSRKLYAKSYFVLVAAWTACFLFRAGLRSAETACLLIVCALYLFAYANATAFLKRSVSFALLEHCALPPQDRMGTLEHLIDLDARLVEMMEHRWIAAAGGRYAVTGRGRVMLALYRLFSRIFSVEAVA